MGIAAAVLLVAVGAVTQREAAVDRSLGRTTWRVPSSWIREVVDVSGQPARDTVVFEIPWANLHPRIRALSIGGAAAPSGLQVQFWSGDSALARLAVARASGSYTKVDNPDTGVDVWFDATQRRVAGGLGHAVGRLRDRPEIEFECDVPMPNWPTPTCALLFPYRTESGGSITAYVHARYAYLRTSVEVVDRLLPVLRTLEHK